MELFQELYLKNTSIEEIVKQTGLSKPSLYRKLKKLGITRKYGESHKGRKLTEEHKNNIKLALSKIEIKGRPPTMINNKGMTDDLAYILGVMYGDGYIMGSGGIGLEVKDFDFLEEFSNSIIKQFEIKGNIYNGKHPKTLTDWRNGKTYNVKQTKILRIGSVLISDYITKIKNFDTVKSFSNTQKISFLRGLWDSEGSVNIHPKHPTLNFTHNSEELIKLFIDLLFDVSEIKMTYYKKTEQGNFVAHIQTKLPIKKFYEIINPTIKRKRLVFEEIIKSFK